MTHPHQYHFRLGTSSFIYPADYITNVRKLMPRVDEIELLLFESHQLPSRQEIAELEAMARDHGKTYNVHLPMDISMGDASRDVRTKSVSSIARAIERVAPLAPTTQTLHLTYTGQTTDAQSVRSWQERTLESMAHLLQISRLPSRQISVETLDFDPQWLTPIVMDLDLAVCIDVGHVIRYGFDLPTVLEMFSGRIAIVHLHGVKQGVDHRSIRHLDPQSQEQIATFLNDFKGSLCIEVFSLNRFESSFKALPLLMSRGTRTKAGPAA